MGKKKASLSLNFIFQSVYQLLTLLLPLVTTPYISRVLGAENTGVYSYTSVIASYFVAVAALGIEAYGNRSIAKARSNGQEEINKVFSEIFSMHAIVSVLVLAAYFIYALFIAGEYRTLLLLQSFLVIGALFDINWFFFGIEEFKLTVTRNVIVKLLTVAAMFAFVRTSADLWKYVLIMALGTFISQSVVWVFLPKYASFCRVTLGGVFRHLKPLLVLFVAVLATVLYLMIDKQMIGEMCDMDSLGCYEYADRLIRMPVTLITALGTVMLPRMSALYAQKQEEQAKRYLKSTSQFVFFLSFAIACGLAAVSEKFVTLFLGSGYEPTVLFVRVLTAAIPFMGWNNLVRTQILMPKAKDRVYTRAVWAGAVINIILNAVLIYFYGAVGAAIATVASYLTVGIFQTFPLRKEYKIRKYLSYGIVPAIAGALMLIAVRAVDSALDVSAAALTAEIALGAAVYLAISGVYLWKTKNEIFCSYTAKILNKFHR